MNFILKNKTNNNNKNNNKPMNKQNINNNQTYLASTIDKLESKSSKSGLMADNPDFLLWSYNYSTHCRETLQNKQANDVK